MRKINFSFLVVLGTCVHVFYFTHLEPAGPCMFFISRSLVQRAVHVFFSRSLVQRGSACFFFSHTSGPRGRACFFFRILGPVRKINFRTTNILTFGDFFWRASCATGPVHVFFFRTPWAAAAVHVFFSHPPAKN